jgi:cytochrome c-type biogenesis protein CcmH/NrfF
VLIQTASYPSNWELSAARATYVIKYLVEKFGFSPSASPRWAMRNFVLWRLIPLTTAEHVTDRLILSFSRAKSSRISLQTKRLVHQSSEVSY